MPLTILTPNIMPPSIMTIDTHLGLSMLALSRMILYIKPLTKLTPNIMPLSIMTIDTWP